MNFFKKVNNKIVEEDITEKTEEVVIEDTTDSTENIEKHYFLYIKIKNESLSIMFKVPSGNDELLSSLKEWYIDHPYEVFSIPHDEGIYLLKWDAVDFINIAMDKK